MNFRIHGLNVMRCRQNSGETIDEFITRSRNLAKKCQFTTQNLMGDFHSDFYLQKYITVKCQGMYIGLNLSHLV